MRQYQFKIRGSRGSHPQCCSSFYRYGGHTTCFSVETPESMFIFDAGTGIQAVSDELYASPLHKPISLFFSHYHLDHLIGLPMFKPLYDRNAVIHLYGSSQSNADWKQYLERFMGDPYWPVKLEHTKATVDFHNLEDHAEDLQANGFKVSWIPVPHTQTCLAYKLDLPNSALVIATDHEPDRNNGKAFLDFCQGADVLIHDAQYTDDEYEIRQGWGHSTWRKAAEIACETGVGELILTHHDTSRTDDEIDAIVKRARRVFSNTRAAHEGLTLHV